jgi:hypothetical protein
MKVNTAVEGSLRPMPSSESFPSAARIRVMEPCRLATVQYETRRTLPVRAMATM